MQALRAELAVLAHVFALEQSESARDGRTARESRQRHHAMPSVLDRVRRRRAGLVRGEVLSRKDAAKRANVIGDRGRELAVIQHLRTAARDGLERTREIGLHQAIGGLEPRRRAVGRAARTVVHALRLGVLVKPNGGCPKDERAVPVHDEAVAREPDRGFEQTRPRQLPEAAMRELIGGDGAGHRDREGTLDVGIVLHRGPSVHARASVTSHKLEHLGPRRERRARRPVE